MKNSVIHKVKYISWIGMLFLLLPLWGCAAVPPQAARSPYKFSKNNKYNKHYFKSLLARVTVYWAKGRGSDHMTRAHKSATGIKLHDGHCAVDARKVPYGSKILYPDGDCDIAVDCGTDVINRKAARHAGRTVAEKSAIVIDKFFETKQQALQWERCHPMFLSVQIIPPWLDVSQGNEWVNK